MSVDLGELATQGASTGCGSSSSYEVEETLFDRPAPATSAGSIRTIDPKSLLKTTSGRTSGQSGVGKGAAGSTLEYEITWSQQSLVESADAMDAVSWSDGILVRRARIFCKKS